MELQYEVTESRLLQEVLPCGYVDSALPQWTAFQKRLLKEDQATEILREMYEGSVFMQKAAFL